MSWLNHLKTTLLLCKDGKTWLPGHSGAVARFSRLFEFADQRQDAGMFKLDILFELVVDLIRSLLADGLSDRVRVGVARFRFGRRVRGMHAVRRHIHRECRRKLFQRLST